MKNVSIFLFFSALLASFFPGAGSLVGLSTRSAYYTARAANSLTNLARKLNTTARTIWRVTNNAVKLTTFVTMNLKKIILGSNSVSIGMNIFFTLHIFSTFGVWFYTAKVKEGKFDLGKKYSHRPVSVKAQFISMFLTYFQNR